jgi:aminoglycoside phosphotransferase (APT) family kinase protein
MSNLTYEVVFGLSDGSSASFVLRRPPLDHILATAHDITREYRVTRALHGATGPLGEVPVPRPYLLCHDTSVIGAPFYLMTKIPGRVYRTAGQFDELEPEAARQVSFALVDTLTSLHALDPRTVGLADFGRPEGYLKRQLVRWERQYADATRREIPDIARLAKRLRARVPEPQRAAVLHGDYQLANVMLRRETHQVVALLDWELSTLGDPLADLGMLIASWDNPVGDAPPRGRGFLTADELVANYVARSGLEVGELDWYVAFNYLKRAVILEISYTVGRYRGGYREEFARAGRAVAPLAAAGLARLPRRSRTVAPQR